MASSAWIKWCRMELSSQLFGDLLTFVYQCFDRIVIQRRSERPEQEVDFVRHVLRVRVVSKEVFRQRTDDYRNRWRPTCAIIKSRSSGQRRAFARHVRIVIVARSSLRQMPDTFLRSILSKRTCRRAAGHILGDYRESRNRYATVAHTSTK